jgi:hypothetical protein
MIDSKATPSRPAPAHRGGVRGRARGHLIVEEGLEVESTQTRCHARRQLLTSRVKVAGSGRQDCKAPAGASRPLVANNQGKPAGGGTPL